MGGGPRSSERGPISYMSACTEEKTCLLAPPIPGSFHRSSCLDVRANGDAVDADERTEDALAGCAAGRVRVAIFRTRLKTGDGDRVAVQEAHSVRIVVRKSKSAVNRTSEHRSGSEVCR